MEKREGKKELLHEVIPIASEIKNNKGKTILWTLLIVSFFFFFILLLFFSSWNDYDSNVAIIPLDGIITANGENYLGQKTATSQEIIELIEDAEEKPEIKAIILEINSPGGSPVASDEIGSAIKKAQKPVIAVIRDVGASGGYWVASAADYIIANRMSITGSIGVISSYLEFSGLMEKYGVNYERLVAGEFKDLGTPFKKLENNEKEILQRKLGQLQDYFIKEIAQNRKLEESKVRAMATGEFFLGGEALELGLIDQLGDTDTAKEYLQKKYALSEIKTIRYETKTNFLEMLTKVWMDFPFQLGRGIGSLMERPENKVMFI